MLRCSANMTFSVGKVLAVYALGCLVLSWQTWAAVVRTETHMQQAHVPADHTALRDFQKVAPLDHFIRTRQIDFPLESFLDFLGGSDGMSEDNSENSNSPEATAQQDINQAIIERNNLIVAAGVAETPAPTQIVRTSMNSGLRR